jgi:hypothetical protein
MEASKQAFMACQPFEGSTRTRLVHRVRPNALDVRCSALIAQELRQWTRLQDIDLWSIATWCALDLMDSLANRKDRMLVVAFKRTSSVEPKLFYEVHDAEAVSADWVRSSFKDVELDPERELALREAENRNRPGSLGVAMVLLYEVGPHETRSAKDALASVCVALFPCRVLTSADRNRRHA